MEKLEVGKKYPKEINREGIWLDYDNGFTLYLFLPKITEKEADSIRTGKFKFALTEISDTLFFLYEFKNEIAISDAPFHFGLYSDDRINSFPDISGETEGLALNIIAVDSMTGIVKALRLIGLGTKFSEKLINICQKQSKEVVDPSLYGENIKSVQSRYNAKDLLRFASITYKG